MIRFILLGACLVSASVQAWDCKYEKRIDQELDLAGSEELSVMAAAGDLEITGSSGSQVARIKGRVCVSEEEWLDESGVEARSGKRAEIEVQLPDTSGWSLMGRRYAYIDLDIEVPDSLALEVKDSSGDVEISGVGAVSVTDSSGDVTIEDSAGPVEVEDSSGDIEFADIKGDVTIESDSSGDITGHDIGGTVLVVSDSSGEIRFRDVGENFIVERDSSGDISAHRVGGDFEVLRDGSGDIDATDVEGEVRTPDDRG